MYALEKELIPYPQRVTKNGGDTVIGKLHAPKFTFAWEQNDAPVFEEAVALMKKTFAEKFCITDCNGTDVAYRITLRVDAAAEEFSDIAQAEAYCIKITDTACELIGKDPAGAFYAAITFAQLAHVEGISLCLPLCTIVDYPDFSRRGNFIECRYGTEFLTCEDWKRAIDYFASMKNNQLTIGVYGCWTYQYDNVCAEYLYVPIKKYPELKTPKSIRYFSVRENKWIDREQQLPTMFEEDYLSEVIAYGKKKNVTVKPLFNSLGHNTLIPSTFPEVSAKREDGTPTGCGFCTRTEKTYEFLYNIYDEIIDRYLAPNGIDSIQIGLDEVWGEDICKCPKCKDSTHQELMIEFIIPLCKHLKARGMKNIYIYHDMLYNSFNCVNEELKELFIKEDIYNEVILDWWTYEDPDHLFWDKVDGVNGLFRSTIKPFTGYYHWTIPTENNPNIRACAEVARKHGFEGMEAYSSLEYCFDKNYYCLAEAAWNTERALNVEDFDKRYAYLRFPNTEAEASVALDAMSIAMEVETHAGYRNSACDMLEYYPYCYRTPYSSDDPTLTLKPFPQSVFDTAIDPEKKRFRDYLQMLAEKSALAVDFFENRSRDVGFYNDMWLLNAKHYQMLADEYLTLWRFKDEQETGTIDRFALVSELDRLIAQRERVMNLTETVRFPASQYTYLRNMSVFRQYYIELREHIKAGGEFALSLPNSDIYTFIR